MALSIIVPCYNVGKYVTRCLDSLHSQTQNDFELIFVNDCSTDDTLEKINSYIHLSDFKDFKLVDLQENGGLANARNVGIEHASWGGYIAFVDSDDWLEPDFVEQISRAISENCQPDMIALGAYLCADEKHKDVLTLSIHNLEEQIRMNVRGLWSTAWRFCYNFDFLRNHQLSFDKKLRSAEDYLFVNQVSFKVKTFAQIDKPLYNYFTDNPNSLMGSINLRGLQDQIISTERVERSMDECSLRTRYGKELDYRYLYIKKLFFKTSLKLWRSWKPESNKMAYGSAWRTKDKLVFEVMKILSKGL